MHRQISPPCGDPSDAIKGTHKNPDNDEQNDDLFAAAAAAAGVPVPSHFKTPTRRWLVLVLVALTGACASGPISSWPTLEPLLIREHVFEGPNQTAQLSQVYSLATGIGMIGNLLMGILFDVLGARVVAMVGAWGCAVSLLCMAFAVKLTSMNWLLWIAYPAACVFGSLNSFCVYAWYWLLPDSQNSVSAVYGSIQLASDSFVMLAVWLHGAGVSVPYYFILVAGLAVIAGIIARYYVPSLDEQLANSAAVIKYMYPQPENSDAQYGSCEGRASKPPPSDKGTVDGALSATKGALRATFTWWMRMFPRVNFINIAYQTTNYIWSMFPQIEMFPLYKGLMGAKTAKELVNVWGGLYPVVGMLSVLGFGRFVDYFGFIPTIIILIPPSILNTYLFSIQSIGFQVVAQVLLSFFANTWYVLAPRFVQYYAPPELFGTIFGLQSTILGIGQLLGTPLSKQIASTFEASFSMTGGGTAIVLSTGLWCGLYVASTAGLLLYWWYHPLPAVGSVTMDDIRSAESHEAEPNEDEEYAQESKSQFPP